MKKKEVSSRVLKDGKPLDLKQFSWESEVKLEDLRHVVGNSYGSKRVYELLGV